MQGWYTSAALLYVCDSCLYPSGSHTVVASRVVQYHGMSLDLDIEIVKSGVRGRFVLSSQNHYYLPIGKGSMQLYLNSTIGTLDRDEICTE